MPTYEYRCKECKKVFEVVLMLSQAGKARPKCPRCGKRRVTKLISGFTAQTDSKS